MNTVFCVNGRSNVPGDYAAIVMGGPGGRSNAAFYVNDQDPVPGTYGAGVGPRDPNGGGGSGTSSALPSS